MQIWLAIADIALRDPAWISGWQKQGIMYETEIVIIDYSLPAADRTSYGITAGPDKALWFTEQVGNRIGRISVAGAVIEYPLPPLTDDQLESPQGRTERSGSPNSSATRLDALHGTGVSQSFL